MTTISISVEMLPGDAADDESARLMRESTSLKKAGDMAGAIDCLRRAKELMLKSRICYPIETWCKLPRYLKDAGRFDEAIAEMHWMIDDLPRRATKEFHVDDPSVFYAKGKNKKKMAADMCRYQKGKILFEMARCLDKARAADAKKVK